MGKSMQRSKKRKLDQLITSTQQDSIIDIPNDELTITLSTLQTLSQNPADLKTNKKYKQIRKLVFDLYPILNGDKRGDIITESLKNGRWEDGLSGLEEMRKNGKVPKLGSVQRWVRFASQTIQTPSLYYPILESIIRTSDPSQIFTLPEPKTSSNYITKYPPFIIPPNPDSLAHPNTYDKSINFDFLLVCNEKGNDDETHIKIFRSLTDFSFSCNRVPGIECISVPFVQGGFIMSNVFSLTECAQLLHASEKLGYADDFGYSFSQDMSYGAAGCVWLMDDAFLQGMFDRVRQFLPGFIQDGRKRLFGLNSRFRFYRYSHAAKYRPHIDGSWPGSGLDSNQSYVFDKYGPKIWSAYTCLIYLNEDFKGGETSFFWSWDGVLQCKGIKPQSGAVVIFPHGDTSGALVHEGSLVEDGFKYVIRTDVLYEKV